MPKIIVLPHDELCPEGAVLDAEKGESVLDVALKNDIGIEHACEKVCACTTCHVIIREGFDSLEESDEIPLISKLHHSEIFNRDLSWKFETRRSQISDFYTWNNKFPIILLRAHVHVKISFFCARVRLCDPINFHQK